MRDARTFFFFFEKKLFGFFCFVLFFLCGLGENIVASANSIISNKD